MYIYYVHTVIGKAKDIITIQGPDAQWGHIINSLHTHSIPKNFFKHDNILYKLIQDGDKSFEALVFLKSLVLTILEIAHDYQDHAFTNNVVSNQNTLLLEENMERHT